MNLAILHYHLNRGGVTKVVENHLRSLDSILPAEHPWSVAVLYGGRREGWPDGLAAELHSIRHTLEEIPSLEYDSVREQSSGKPDGLCPLRLAEEIQAVLDRLGFVLNDTVLHVHNHSLGKNASLPGAIRILAGRGLAMVLEPHDFAEDFRPGNFRWLADRLAAQDPDGWHGWLYPQASHLHYALLNGRDRSILREAGVVDERLHLLPNPVPEIQGLPPRDEARARLTERFGVATDERLVLYPVRGIRRKNVGEAVLYAALAPAGTVVGLTLPPLNPAEQTIYSEWKTLADELRLPMRFELGAPGGLEFGENMAAADAILTTSVAEGFGMVFLESWLAGRPLVGRDLPEITADFVQNGLQLDSLRPTFSVPVEWIGEEAFGRAVSAAYRRALAAFNRDEPIEAADVIAAKISDGLVDFGDLDEPLQRTVIRTVSENAEARRRLLALNPWMEATVFSRQADIGIDQNIAAVDRHYATEPSGRRLLALYEQAVRSPRDPEIRPLQRATQILDAFLQLERFRAIRS